MPNDVLMTLLMAINPLVTLRGYEVLHLLKPLSTLFEPRIVWAVLNKSSASRLQKPEPEAVMTPDEEYSRENNSQTPVHSAALSGVGEGGRKC